MRIYREESSGRVGAWCGAKDFQRGVRPRERPRVLGNGASIFTRDGNTAREFTDRVQAVMVGVNVPIPTARVLLFRRLEALGFGDQNQHWDGRCGFFTKLKTGDVAVAECGQGPEFQCRP